ncbi:TetR/AcrR family transcriptional regulator [Micromonospora sp. NPDC049559]|uniref:TetR/AcrR family transcriptional regulator n=1 Tax=Micromonospora sp. NPDC049559 TaxID=3155923 RepID=UPI003422D1B5
MGTNRGGRRPDPAVDTAVREALVELLFERGFDMTFDDVAARAGVGRTTVFRRYPTKRELLLDAVGQVTVGQITLPDTGSLRGDLTAGLTQIMRVFDAPGMRVLFRQCLGEACRDPLFTDVLRANLDRRLELITRLLARSVERGELSADTDVAVFADLLSGVIAIRMATDTPLPDAAEISTLVDGLLHGFAAK